MSNDRLGVRGFLMHAGHYDPAWCRAKETEAPFDANSAMRVVDAMADAGMNLLVLDCADGVRYRTHPELRRAYSVPMTELRAVAAHARSRGIDVVPKLNFSKSNRNRHDEWMMPHVDPISWTAGLDTYWRVAADTIGELVEALKPSTYFHIGMDEDHCRSLRQYVRDVKILRRLVCSHRLRTVMWNDSCHDAIGSLAQVYAEKIKAAEAELPRDIVHVLWHYSRVFPSAIRRLTQQGFDVWAAPGKPSEQVRRWRRAIRGNGGTGLLMTHWIKCTPRHEAVLIDLIHRLGPAY